MMETELTNLLDALGAKNGWGAAILTWMAALRIVIKPFSARVLQKLNETLERVAQSPETDDDLLIERVLRHRSYRWAAFLLDLLTSFKLPSHADFTERLHKKL